MNIKKTQLKIKEGNLSNKGQLKIQEMSFMIIALVIFFILVGLFAFSIFFKNVQEQATDIAEDKTISGISNLAGSAEFNCGKPNCIDGDKLIVLLERESYQNFWPFVSLRVVKQDAFNKTYREMVKCNLVNYPDCELFTVYDKNLKNVVEKDNFVSLCWKEKENSITYNKCELAKFVAGYEVKDADN
jgi:hypothetical protein